MRLQLVTVVAVAMVGCGGGASGGLGGSAGTPPPVAVAPPPQARPISVSSTLDLGEGWGMQLRGGPEGKGMVAAWMAQDGLHSLDGNPQPRQVSVAKFSLAQSGAILTTDEEDFVRALYGVATILVPEHLGGVLNDDGTKVAFADSGVWETDLDPL